MVVNFLTNMLIFSLRKKTFSFLIYVVLRFSAIAMQVLFFELCFGILVATVQIEDFIIIKLISFLCLSVIFLYYSRDFSLKIQSEIIKHIFLNKLNLSKNNKKNWIRPIVVELWNAIDAIIILSVMVILVSYLTSSFLALVIFFCVAFIWVKLGVFYIKKWALLNDGKAPEEILFWRLRQQNIIESLLLGLILFVVAACILGGLFDDVDAQISAITIVLSRTFITIITKQVSTIPRIARYFSSLPSWPKFWKKGKWL